MAVIERVFPTYIFPKGGDVCMNDSESASIDRAIGTGFKVIHTLPNMGEFEREKAKSRIGNDLFEVFLRIQMELKIESE